MTFRIARTTVPAVAAAFVVATVVAGGAFAQPPGFGDVKALEVRAVPHKSVARPGDPVVIAVELAHEPGFHTWPNDPVVPEEFGGAFQAIATTIDVTRLAEGSVLQPIQWPEPVPVTVYYTMSPVELLSYTGTMVAYVPLTLPADAALGDAEIELTVGYQACDETNCYAPAEVPLMVPLTIAAAGGAASETLNEPELFSGFDLASFSSGAPAAAPAERITMSAFGLEFSMDPTGAAGMALLLTMAALGGLLLNFTPCVLPVLPLKVMGLSKAAGNPKRLFLLGLLMSLGVVAFWLVLGGAIAYVSGFSAISSLFQTGWFSLLVGVIVAVMAIGMFGVFEVTLPQAVYRARPDQETLHGSFLFGVLTAILATPCTAPFMGAAAAWAATREPQVTMATFAAIGIGMAAPYLVLTARPSLLARVPRTGPASVLVKQVMGLLMLAVASFFIGLWLSSVLQTPPDPPSRAYWWLVAFWIVVACAWAVVQTFRISSAAVTRAAVTTVATAGSLAAVLLARDLTGHGPIAWTYYTPERFATAEAEGDVVVMDFTAEWCLNCRALESGVLNQPGVASLLGQPGVVPMRVDLTGDNPDGKAKLSELEWVGIPLLAVFGPATGYDEPLKYDTYTQQVVIDAVEDARGQP